MLGGQTAHSTACRARIEAGLISDGDVTRVEGARARKRLKSQAVAVPMKGDGGSSSADPSAPRADVTRCEDGTQRERDGDRSDGEEPSDIMEVFGPGSFADRAGAFDF